MNLPELIEALSQPAAYPHRPDEVEIRQTHISVVFLAGPYVYKIKKPVNPGFLDFTTLEKRRHFCEEEVRLNRRLAPQVYLGVVPVARSGPILQFEGKGEVIEWAVKMQRLPDAATFQELLRRGQVDEGPAEALAKRIAAFHQHAETHGRIAAFGRFETVARVVLDIYALAAAQVGTTVSQAVLARARKLTEDALQRLRPLIDERAARGVTRDCHGDLHLDHVYLLPDRRPPNDLVIIDCIEFNERFRFIDPVADMAFPAMDFAFHGRRDLARAFVEAYFRASGDEEGRALLPLYTAYRASVRGAVEGLLLTETEVPESERAAALARARAHWLLALSELESPQCRPGLLLVTGLSGTGKTVLAQGLAECAGFQVIRSDVVRKELAGISSTKPTPPHLLQSLYAPEMNDRTYAECLHRCEKLLFEGKRVLVDATFREDERRQTFLSAAVRWAVPFGLLVCQAAPETVRTRLDARQADASDADWSVYEQLARNWDELGTLSRRVARWVSTEGRPEQALPLARQALRELGLLDGSI